MKKYLLILTAVLALAACKNNQPKNQNAAEATQTENSAVAVFSLDNLMANAETQVGKTVKVTGYVTHTCKHSGRRCFIADEENKVNIRVEAKGKIGGFNRELVGSKIEVTGALREKRLSTAEIDEMEKAIAEKRVKGDGSEESCDAETANVQKMREWMKERGKDYYAIYYIDGEEYSEVK